MATFVYAVLLVLLVVKCWSMIRCLVWTWRYGERYAARFAQCTPADQSNFFVRAEIARSLHGDFLPFGIKVKGIRHCGSWVLGSPPSRLSSTVSRAVEVLTTLYILVPVGSFVLVVEPVFHPEVQVTSTAISLGYISAMLLITVTMFSGLSVACDLIVAGSLPPDHMGIPGSSYASGRGIALGQGGTLIGSVLCGWIAASAGVIFVANEIGGFVDWHVSTAYPITVKPLIFAAYNVFLTALGMKDVDQYSASAMLAMFLIVLAAFMLLIAALSVLVSVVSVAPEAAVEVRAQPTRRTGSWVVVGILAMFVSIVAIWRRTRRL